MIVEIKDSKEKQAISRKVLEALTDWFGIEESREEYISDSADWTLFAAKEEDEAIGFLCFSSIRTATTVQSFSLIRIEADTDMISDIFEIERFWEK